MDCGKLGAFWFIYYRVQAGGSVQGEGGLGGEECTARVVRTGRGTTASTSTSIRVRENPGLQDTGYLVQDTGHLWTTRGCKYFDRSAIERTTFLVHLSSANVK